MREIKFRVWDNNKYYYQEDIEYISFRDDEIQFMYQDLDTCTVLSKCVIEQYTGLKDKKGVEIYEGDIVGNGVYEFTIIFGNIGYDYRRNGLTGFAFKEDYNENCNIYELKYHNPNETELEVIGNIHQ